MALINFTKISDLTDIYFVVDSFSGKIKYVAQNAKDLNDYFFYNGRDEQSVIKLKAEKQP